jgi:hypothetical protein
MVNISRQPRSVNNVDVENTSHVSRRGLKDRRRSGYEEKDLTFGTWNVRTFQNWSTHVLLSQLKQCRLHIRELWETRWQAKDVEDMKSQTRFYSGKEKGHQSLG